MTRDEVVANFRNGADKGNVVAPYPISTLAPHPVYRPVNHHHFLQAGPEPYEAEYLRVVGGTSWHWAAQAWRVVPNDFRIKSLYDVGVDWPLSYDDLEPFYQHARGGASDGMAYLRGEALPADPAKMSGAQLFDARCATCHQAGGQGSFDRGLPALFHNTVLGRGNGNNLAMAMLEGVQRAQPQGDALETRMPAFRTVMSDQQIATLANYLTQTYGNPAAEDDGGRGTQLARRRCDLPGW